MLAVFLSGRNYMKTKLYSEMHKNTNLKRVFNKNILSRSSHCSLVVTNLTSSHEDLGSIPGLAQWGMDSVLLWLWCRLAPVALI